MEDKNHKHHKSVKETTTQLLKAEPWHRARTLLSTEQCPDGARVKYHFVQCPV